MAGWLGRTFSNLALWALAVILTQSAFAQVGAVISGRVADVTGAAVADAAVAHAPQTELGAATAALQAAPSRKTASAHALLLYAAMLMQPAHDDGDTVWEIKWRHAIRPKIRRQRFHRSSTTWPMDHLR